MHSPPDDPVSTQIERLQQPLRGRRQLSWLMFLGVLVLCLVIPILASVAPTNRSMPARQMQERAGPIATQEGSPIRPDLKAGTVSSPPRATKASLLQLDSVWNPGTVSSPHQPWAKDCKICHSTPFARVQDADCLACHKAIGDHVDRKKVTIEGLHDVRCATCHREHQGNFGLAEQNTRYMAAQCADCHGNIKESYANTATLNVTDFARGHPEFRIQVATGMDEPKLKRIRPSKFTKLADTTHLKFPHDIHLLKTGVNSPEGRIKMVCSDCHQPNADQIGFSPVTMKDHCQSCHALKFEPAVFNREVPHGSVDDVLSTLREFYSYVGVQGVPLNTPPAKGPVFRLRPGKEPSMQSFVKSSGDARTQAAAAAIQLFEKTSCVICHEITRVSGSGRSGTPGKDLPQWRITPVGFSHAWMPKAQFSHAKHATTQCTDCHNAAVSKKATDVLMPSIGQCTDCHAGNRPEKNKVTSDCGLCHGFHLPAHTSKALPVKMIPTSAKELR